MHKKFASIFLVGLLFGCAETTTSIPTVPDTGAVAAADIRSLVEGGPYALRIFDGDIAGTVGQSTWDFRNGTVSGSFTTPSGETGTFSNPIAVRGNQLCNGEGASEQCYFIYPYQNGFMEVTAAGAVHATSLPM